MNRGLGIGNCALHRRLLHNCIVIVFSVLSAAYLCIASNDLAGTTQTPDEPGITGRWQGALKTPDGQLRIVIEIFAEMDKLKANFYSIDQRSPAIPAGTVTWDGSILRMTLVSLSGSYQGKMSADGNSISGTFSGSGRTTRLSLARATPTTAWAIPEPPAPPKRMDLNANPEFEVATIKPSHPSRTAKGITVRGSDVITTNTTLEDLIMIAYGLHAKQITGAPSWSESERFDITGRPNIPGQPNVEQIKMMMRKLLAGRFQLEFRRDKKELSVYALIVAKGGPQFSKSERDPNRLPGLSFRGPGDLNVTNATMEQLAVMLSTLLDKPVLDRTGLPERYDLVLRWAPAQDQFPEFSGTAPATPDTGDILPDLFTAIQRQLGLKLHSTKASADVIVIDRVAKPSEN